MREKGARSVQNPGDNLTNPDDADREIDDFPGFAPLDPEVERTRKKIRDAEVMTPPSIEVPEPKRAKLQFGLLHLFAANTALAIVLALLQVLAPDLTAAALGLAAFIALLWDTMYQPEDPRVRMAVNALLWIYVAVSFIAFVRMAA